MNAEIGERTLESNLVFFKPVHSRNSRKDFEGIQFFPNFIHHRPSHDLVPFQGDNKMSHIFV